MGILINEDGWHTLEAQMCPDEIAERMGMSPETVNVVLRGEVDPCTTFIAASLESFPMSFTDLFRIKPRF